MQLPRSHTSAHKLASAPCRAPSANQPTATPVNSASLPWPRLSRCTTAYREEYGGIEYGGLPVKYSVFTVPQRFTSELLRWPYCLTC
jgi:hypothetical protein